MHNDNETWYVLKRIYVEKISNINKNYVYCGNALIFHIVVFSFDYIARNDNKTTNKSPKPSDF